MDIPRVDIELIVFKWAYGQLIGLHFRNGNYLPCVSQSLFYLSPFFMIYDTRTLSVSNKIFLIASILELSMEEHSLLFTINLYGTHIFS